jgi:hypothetical protein
MNERAAIPNHDDPAAWAQAVLRRQVERLDELAELGMRMAQAIQAEKAGGAVTVFSRVAKVVRLCGLLQARLIKDMDEARRRALIYAPMTEQADALAETRERARLDPAHEHKARIEKIVERQVKALHRDDEEEVERLMLEACERLDDDDIYRDVLNRPVGELVALICRDLGVEPDWPRLAEEAWAQDEIAAAPPGSPFLHLPREAAGGGPLAEERAVEGAGGYGPPFDRPPERPHTWSG